MGEGLLGRIFNNKCESLVQNSISKPILAPIIVILIGKANPHACDHVRQKMTYHTKSSCPKVTIITSVFNGEKYLESAIQSVIDQDYSNIEYIVVDGGSTDGTLDIIRKYEKFISKWISEKDDGMYYAINRGIRLAEGDIIGNLNADDLLYDSNVVSKIADQFSNSKIDFLYGDLQKIDEFYGLERNIKLSPVSYDTVLSSGHSTFVPHPAFYIRKACIEELGLYDERYKYASDFDLILRCMKRYSGKHLGFRVAKFRVHPSSITASGKLESERIAILEKYGVIGRSSISDRVRFLAGWALYLSKNIHFTYRIKKLYVHFRN